MQHAAARSAKSFDQTNERKTKAKEKNYLQLAASGELTLLSICQVVCVVETTRRPACSQLY